MCPEPAKFLILVKIFPVSHLKERTEKNCLNCKTDLIGRYCHVCGQENLEPKETVWHLVQHFFNDITHFDGKFFSTVKYLLRKPGFLSREYMEGRRASYLNPVRMYVFTSAIFFLILFSLKGPSDYVHSSQPPESGEDAKKRTSIGVQPSGDIIGVTMTDDKSVRKGLADLAREKAKLEAKLKKADDEDDREDYRQDIRKIDLEGRVIRQLYGDTSTLTFDKTQRIGFLLKAYEDSLKETDLPQAVRTNITILADKLRKGEDEDDNGFPALFGWNEKGYRSVASYDSAENAMPESARDSWMGRTFTRKIIAANEEYHRDKHRYWEHFIENLLHSFPKILFFSLPFFALFLNILYAREKKEFFYVSHGIFAIHVYCATFILILVTTLLNELKNVLDWRWLHILINILVAGIAFYIFIYLYKAMRGFYRQGRVKTFIKYFIMCTLSFILNLILLLIFLAISAVSV
jgi:uncharacterized protein DUF3667